MNSMKLIVSKDASKMGPAKWSKPSQLLPPAKLPERVCQRSIGATKSTQRYVLTCSAAGLQLASSELLVTAKNKGDGNTQRHSTLGRYRIYCLPTLAFVLRLSAELFKMTFEWFCWLYFGLELSLDSRVCVFLSPWASPLRHSSLGAL